MPTTDEKTRKLVALSSYQQLPPELRAVVKLALLYGIHGPEAVSLMDLPNPTRTWESDRVQRVVTAYGTADIVDDYVARLEAAREVRPQTDENTTPLKCHTVDTFEKAESPQSFIGGRTAEDGAGIPGNRPEPKSAAVCECGAPAGSSYGDRRLCPVCMVRALGLRPLHPNPPAPVAPAVPAQSAGPADTRCPNCALILCGCHRGETAPTRPEIVLGGTDSGIDPKDLFPGINQQLTKGGPSTADLWREQRSIEEAERESLLRQHQEQQAARDAASDREILFTPRPSWR
jgi:hypothetical protein